MNYQDIEKLASLKESNNLEFKESTGQLDRSMETLCAFLGSVEKYWGCFFCFIVFCIFAL